MFVIFMDTYLRKRLISYNIRKIINIHIVSKHLILSIKHNNIISMILELRKI